MDSGGFACEKLRAFGANWYGGGDLGSWRYCRGILSWPVDVVVQEKDRSAGPLDPEGFISGACIYYHYCTYDRDKGNAGVGCYTSVGGVSGGHHDTGWGLLKQPGFVNMLEFTCDLPPLF